MKIGLMQRRWLLPGAIVVVAGVGLSAGKGLSAVAATPSMPAIASASTQTSAAQSDAVRPVLSELLPNVPGKRLTAVRVNYAPGGKSPAHHHSGSVFAYVLSGSIRSEVSTSGPVKVYTAGDSFFEPPGSTHLVSENASATEPASLLAVFIADDGAQLTAPGHAAGAK
jgi:quercetin dioxygenase-like cupin family protein